MYNEGYDEGDGCPTRDPLPWPALAPAVSVLGVVCRSVACYSAAVFFWPFLSMKQMISWKRWPF